MNIIEKINEEQVAKLVADRKIPDFRAGDTVKVLVKVVEGARERMQAFDGFVLAKKNRSINSSFKVRKISNGVGVERLFPLYSPNIQIDVMKHGKVRRAKLYYLRTRLGKSARIAERRLSVAAG
ncbi:50S ribosomal protein L19 [Alphaproteobacteria bacterium]|nr:50S ribosomal protein L19 [Alphaproteobacteria bacterium]